MDNNPTVIAVAILTCVINGDQDTARRLIHSQTGDSGDVIEVTYILSLIASAQFTPESWGKGMAKILKDLT